MRVDNKEEKLEFGEFEYDDASASKSEGIFKEKGKSTEFLGDFRRVFLHQSASECGRKKMSDGILLDSSIESKREDATNLSNYS